MQAHQVRSPPFGQRSESCLYLFYFFFVCVLGLENEGAHHGYDAIASKSDRRQTADSMLSRDLPITHVHIVN